MGTGRRNRILSPYRIPRANWSKYFQWRERFTEPQLRGRLEQYLSRDRGRDMHITPIIDVVAAGQTSGGRVTQLVIRTQDDSYTFQKDRIRWVIGRSSNPDLILPSTRFTVQVSRDANNRVTAITFDGGGYGPRGRYVPMRSYRQGPGGMDQQSDIDLFLHGS